MTTCIAFEPHSCLSPFCPACCTTLKYVVDLIINHTGFEPRSQSYSLSSFRYCVIFFDSCKTVCYCSFAIDDILLDLLGEKRLRCEEIRAVTNLEILQLRNIVYD